MVEIMKRLSTNPNGYCDKVSSYLLQVDETFSPLSAYLATVAVLLGSNNKTREQLQHFLQNQSADSYSDSDLIAGRIKELLNIFKKYNNLSINNILFCDSRLELNKNYEDVAANIDALILRTDFRDPDRACEEINSIISQKTKGLINNFYDKGNIKDDTKLIIANTLYFYAKWRNPFELKNTTKKPFTKLNGQVSEVDMMYINSDKLWYLENDKFQLVEKSYMEDEFALGFILFKDEFDINSISFQHLYENHLKNAKICDVELSIPKFRQESTLNMKDIMQSYGVYDLFDPDNCDLSELTQEPVYVDDTRQKVVFIVNEEETEAAAVTCSTMRVRSMSRYQRVVFNANKTFLYYIIHPASNTILFVGIFDGQ